MAFPVLKCAALGFLMLGCDKPPTQVSANPTKAVGISVLESVNRTNETSYAKIRGGHSSSRPVSLCELLLWYNAGAGAYVVRSITGYSEPFPGVPNTTEPHTYIELELVADWSGNAPKNPVVRIVGGPMPNGATRSWDFTVQVGETVGALLESPSPQNAGYPTIRELALFRGDRAGYYTNGQLFVKHPAKLDELGRAVEHLAQVPADCAVADVSPDAQDLTPVPMPSALLKPVFEVAKEEAVNAP